MIVIIVLIIILILSSINSVRYLFRYNRLSRAGSRSDGTVVSFHQTSSTWTRNYNIPNIKFLTADGTSIIGMPLYSLFLGLNNFKHAEACVVYYDINKPHRFIYKNTIEVALNIALVIVLLVGIGVFLGVLIGGEY